MSHNRRVNGWQASTVAIQTMHLLANLQHSISLVAQLANMVLKDYDGVMLVHIAVLKGCDGVVLRPMMGTLVALVMVMIVVVEEYKRARRQLHAGGFRYPVALYICH